MTGALPPGVRAAMLAHAREQAPLEACGVVTVTEAGRWARFVPLPNGAAAPDRFRIDPGDLYGAIREAERRHETIGAVFHSHPAGPAVPSDTDVAEWPDRRWAGVVAGLGPQGWALRVYRLGVAGAPVEVEVCQGARG